MSIIMAIVGTILCGASSWLLITNVTGTCSGMLNLVACVGIVVCAVLAADGWYKLLGGKLPGKKA